MKQDERKALLCHPRWQSLLEKPDSFLYNVVCVCVCLGFEEVSKEQLIIDPCMEPAALNLGERMALNVPA